MLSAIETATEPGHYVYILGWMIDVSVDLIPGRSGSGLYDRLCKLPREVEIRILVWDNPISPDLVKSAEAAVKRFLKHENIKIFVEDTTFYPQSYKEGFKKIQSVATLLLPLLRRLIPEFLPVIRSGLKRDGIGSHHEKVTIVKGKDGLVAFCGGIDYNPNRLHHQEGDRSPLDFPSVHDTMCRLQGPAAHQILEKFCLRWHNHPPASAVALAGDSEAMPPEVTTGGHYAWVVGTYNSPDGGEPKTRTLREAYFKILDAAETYVYIEDQYLTNLEVAAHLNRKLKEPRFEKVILVCQASDETLDFLVPNRKRDEFMDRLLDGATEDQRKKVLRTLVDKRFWRQARYHPGLHAKTLIVDDRIAIIGSANVNRRSFTCDSETSVILFDDDEPSGGTFAARFRAATWREYVIRHGPRGFHDDWRFFVAALEEDNAGFAKITRYVEDNHVDIDDFVRLLLLVGGSATVLLNRLVSLPLGAAARKLGGPKSPDGLKLQAVAAAANLATIGASLLEAALLIKARAIVDFLWEHVIDPDGDRR